MDLFAHIFIDEQIIIKKLWTRMFRSLKRELEHFQPRCLRVSLLISSINHKHFHSQQI